MPEKSLLHRVRGANPDQVAILARGVEAWNDWRQKNPHVPIELSEIDLRGPLRQDYAGQKGRGTNLRGINLAGATLRDANLEEANLHGADLEGAYLAGAQLQRAVLQQANLRSATLSTANLEGASFTWAQLNGAVLQGAKMKGAELRQADCSGADLRGVRGAVFDETRLSDAICGLTARDPWSVLRRRYSGVMLVFHVALLMAFSLPFMGRAVFWRAVNHGQTLYSDAAAALVSALNDAETASTGLSVDGPATVARAKVAAIGPCGSEACEAFSVWQVLLQVDRGLLPACLAIGLLLYNVLRGIMTWWVGLMRDEEERSGLTPPWRSIRLRGKLRFWLPLRLVQKLPGSLGRLFVRDTTFVQVGYRPLFNAHRVLTVMFWSIVLSSLIYHGWDILTATVYLRAS